MKMDFTGLDKALTVLGQLLADRNHHYEIVAIGGGCLLLLGLTIRPTRDLDLVALMKEGQLISADPLPKPLQQAASEVGKIFGFENDWLNIGPSTLFDMGLPPGFMSRVHKRDYKGLTVYLADRLDQVYFKLYASVDYGPQSKHYIDLIGLKPTHNELEEAKKWCMTHDVSSTFASELEKALESIHAT